MKQIVEHRRLGAAQGVLLIAVLVAALIGLDYLSAQVLPRWIGARPASLMFWVLGGVVALWVLHEFIVKYVYELSGDILRLSRSYGKRPRHIEDIYLRQIVFVGDPQEAKQRHPKARRVSAKRREKALPVTAVVYKKAEGEGVALIQANEELRARLEACARENRRK